ncbi:hypothetical protein IQ235_04950 [Oscillatoriales cyanobacterium LEGE 11467]|uniref:Type I restriction enzyme R protein N-terminal domain-containing protein n=1 Tax=Zarconia navalis LEGE 11467 TaxID=1828826 RepID=A0A928VYR5_9CYAN|nr:hypothetical protein [Zarconia navalis]MBE9040140.1 hypothetical protein [Zarconia navalis LEGE 11467]
MSIYSIIDPNKSYTFSDYFKLNSEPDEILSYFGYEYEAKSLELPKCDREFDRIDSLKQSLEENLSCVSFISEMARREFLIAPVLMNLIHYTKARIRVAYSLMVNEQLKGELDYYLQSQNQLLVIEAKNADLQKGFTQLAVELIAIDTEKRAQTNFIYGAVSIGNIWQFAVLNSQSKNIIQDLSLYRVPADLTELTKVLVGILGYNY